MHEYRWMFQNVLYKRPMDHIAHMRKQCKAINTNYIITLIRRLKHPRTISFFVSEWSLFVKPLHQRMLCANFGWNWLSGSGEEDYLIASMYFRYFITISPWNRAGPFFWTNLNPLHPRMLCAKFGWNWLSGSGEEDFLILSMYFRYFIIISPWKRAGSFIWTNLNPYTQGCFVPSLVENGSVVLEKKIFKSCQLIFIIFQLSPLWDGRGPSFEHTWIPFT